MFCIFSISNEFFNPFLFPASPTVTWGTWSWCLDLRSSSEKSSFYEEAAKKPFDFQVTEVRDEQERIASLLVAVLVLGIGTGSFLSYPIVNCLWSEPWSVFDQDGPARCQLPVCRFDNAWMLEITKMYNRPSGCVETKLKCDARLNPWVLWIHL